MMYNLIYLLNAEKAVLTSIVKTLQDFNSSITKSSYFVITYSGRKEKPVWCALYFLLYSFSSDP